MAYDVFISYKESDGSLHAAELSNQFKMRGYSSVYFNENEIRQGDFVKRLEAAIESCKVFVLVLTENAKNSILSRTALWGDEEFDYVCWEISKACENNKRVLILNTGCCFDPSYDVEKYKYDEMKNLMVNTGESFAPLHTAQTFKMHQIFDENLGLLKKEKVDISTRMTLRRVIYGVLSLRYKARNSVGNYVDKECIFNKQALEALCEYITNDNSITTEIDACTTAEQLTQYIIAAKNEILQDFCEHFQIEDKGKGSKAINIRIKDPTMAQHYKMDCWEVLNYLYNSYSSMNFHHEYGSERKFYLNRTISDYILALAWNRYFINNQDKRRELVCTIVPALIRTHNHAQGYLYALIEKGRFGKQEQWLFADVNSEYSEQVKALFGEYYQDVFNTDMTRSNFTKTLFAWFNRNANNFVNFCLQLIRDYRCSDANIWNYLINECNTRANRNSLEILKGYFFGYVEQRNIRVVLRMIEHGLADAVYLSDELQKDRKLFLLLCNAAEKKATAEQYSQGLACAFLAFRKKGRYITEIKQLVHKAYIKDGIVAFRNLYNVIEGINPGYSCVVPVENYEEILNTAVKATDNELLENNRFLYVLDNIRVTYQNADLYNRALGRLLDICTFSNYYFGFKILLFVKFRAEWFTDENKQKLFERIADFVNNYGNTIKLEDRHYKKLLEILEDEYFNAIRLKFKMAMFDNESIASEVKMSVFNLWYDSEMKESIKERLLENTSDRNNCTQNAFVTMIGGKNQKWNNFQGWKCAYLYPLISELLRLGTFVVLKPGLQKKLIHHVKTKQEYHLKFKALLDELKKHEDVWEDLRGDVKTAFVMHIDKVVDNFEEIEFINNYAEYIIEDVASMRNRRKEVQQKYGIKEETLMYHMISLYKRKPWKTARLCAAAQIKWYGQLKTEDEWNEYSKKDMLFDRRRLFSVAVSNPCISELTVHLAKANYSNMLQVFDKIAVEEKVLVEHVTLLEEIIKDNIPLWFDTEVKQSCETISGNLKNIENVDLDGVVNDFQKYESDNPTWFEYEDKILNTAKVDSINNFDNKSVDFEDASAKIILWKDSEEDEKLYVLARKKLVARYLQKKILYRGLRFNALLFIPQMCEEVKFAFEADIFDVKTEIEGIRAAIEEKFKAVLITDLNPQKSAFDRFVKKCGVDKAVMESINHFYNAYFNYLRLTQTEPEVAGAFSEYVKYMKVRMLDF